jgi:N12 class adenine-specific DNA methylase
MQWTAESIDRLHELHERYVGQLRADVAAANRSLGSSKPNRSALQRLTRAEFEALLVRQTDDAEVKRLWIRRLIRGHEHEFPELEAATVSSRTVDCDPLVAFSKQRPGKTGT